MSTKLAKSTPPKCKVCKKRPVKQRQVCAACLNAAYRVMAKPDKNGNPPKGKITEQQAIDAGLIGERARYRSDFHKILKEKFPDL